MPTITEKQRASLPPLTDHANTGRHLGWVMIAAEGPLHFRDAATGVPSKINASRAWMGEQISEYARLTEGGYESPFLVEHDKAGTALGHVIRLAEWIDPVDGRARLLAAVRYVADFDAASAIESGAMRWASPSIKPLTDELGRSFRQVVSEVSATVTPHQKTMGLTHFLASEDGAPLTGQIMPEEIKETAPDVVAAEDGAPEETREGLTFAKLAEGLTGITPAELSALGDVIAEMLGLNAPAPMPAVEASEDEDPKYAALLARVEASERKTRRAEFDRDYTTGATLTLSEGNRDAVWALQEAARPETAALFAGLAVAVAPTPAVPVSKFAGSIFPARIGSGSAELSEDDANPTDRAMLSARADKAFAADPSTPRLTHYRNQLEAAGVLKGA